MSKVTCLLSAYYAEPFISRRLDNLFAQLPLPEIVAVCLQGSLEDQVVSQYPEVVVIRTPDVPTVYAAWNMAIGVATGDYLTNTNSDDFLYLGALSMLADALDAHPQHALAYADVNVIREENGPVVETYEAIEGDLNQLLRGCFVGPMPMWRRSLHEKYGLFDPTYKSAGDYEFWLRIAAAGETFFHVPRPVGAYWYREDSVEHHEPFRSKWETARARAAYRKVRQHDG